MDTIRENAARLVLTAAREVIDHTDVDSIAWTAYGAFRDMVRETALDMLEGVNGSMPFSAPDSEMMERELADSKLSLDMLAERAKRAYGRSYSTVRDRYAIAHGMMIDDLLGVES